MLDKRRAYGGVFGNNVAGAHFYQDGHYYTHKGEYVFSNPGANPLPGQKLRTMEEAQALHDARAKEPHPNKSFVRQSPPPQPEATTGGSEVAGTTGSVQLGDGLTREQQLMQLNAPQLSSLMKKAGAEPIRGSGSKQKMIAYLLENTSE